MNTTHFMVTQMLVLRYSSNVISSMRIVHGMVAKTRQCSHILYIMPCTWSYICKKKKKKNTSEWTVHHYHRISLSHRCTHIHQTLTNTLIRTQETLTFLSTEYSTRVMDVCCWMTDNNTTTTRQKNSIIFSFFHPNHFVSDCDTFPVLSSPPV